MGRRGGDGAREVEWLLAHQKVPEFGVGVARSGLSAAARARRRRVVAVGGGPVRDWRGERVGELLGVEAKLDVGSIWAERLWRRGSTAGLRLAGVRWSDGGVPGCLGRERARGRGKRNEESFLEPRRARGKGEIGVLSWAIHGGVRGGGRLDSSGWRGEGRGHQRDGKGRWGVFWATRGSHEKQEVARGGGPERRRAAWRCRR